MAILSTAMVEKIAINPSKTGISSCRWHFAEQWCDYAWANTLGFSSLWNPIPVTWVAIALM